MTCKTGVQLPTWLCTQPLLKFERQKMGINSASATAEISLDLDFADLGLELSD